jgi:intein/homing endonuclease
MATFTNFTPSINQTSVPRTTLVSFTILNGVDGTQINTLGVTIDGYQAILNGSFVNSYTGNIYPSTDRYVVGVYPKGPNFIRGAAQIKVRMQVLDGYNNVDSYGYSFYTDGYNTTPLEPVETGSTRVCSISFPFFPPSDLGLSIAYDEGTGTEATLEWKAAVPYDENNVIYYNIYNNTKRINVFDGYPDFIVSDTSTTIGGFAPGDTNFFGVRVAEFDPDAFTTSGMSVAGTNMHYYPNNARIDGYIGADTLIIPATTTEGFPDYGILIIDSELIRYSIKNYSPARFIISATGRGYANTTAAAHYNSEIVLYPGIEDNNTIIAQATPTFQKPNYAKTYILGDGYGYDGYRDGYDGYAYTDGYFKYKEEIIDSITTDGKNNNEAGDFPRFDYCGSWRALSPQSFMQGQCVKSYFGGAQVRIDEDGYRHSVKTDIRTQLLQREELLLESTGEPFILIKRMWTGMRCTCFMLRREHPDARCPVCFVPGTLVNTKRGLVPIENIKVGEKVLTSDGSFQNVKQVMEREYDGYLCKISSHTTTPILTTPEHPFLTIRGEHNIIRACGPKCNNFINNGDGRNSSPKLLNSGNWQARVTSPDGERISLGTFKDKNDAELNIKNYYNMTFQPQHRLDWDNAKNIKKDDWLVCKWNSTIKDIDFIEIPEKYKKITKLGMKRNGIEKFTVDEDFLWMIGVYIAEGSSGKRAINFALHKNESYIYERLMSIFKKYKFNYSLRTRLNNNGVSLEIYSTSLANWFPNFCGKKCYLKKIPEIFMNLPYNKLTSLIQGIYDGDGSKKYLEIGQTSKILALQIVEILHKLGKQPLLRFQQSKSLTPKGNKKKLCYIVSWEKQEFHHINRKGRWDFKSELLTKVKSNENIPYTGKVYNLEVEGNHTYVIENIIVHNCYGTGFVQGYIQFFNPRRSDRRILIRINPATDDLTIVDRGGFEPVYEPDGWTLPFPQLKDRDMLVRFNEDNTEAWRYEVLNVTRNKVLFAQSGAQLVKIKRLPKTGIIYQFPVVRDTSPYPETITTSVSSVLGIPSHFHQIVVPDGHNILTLKGATLESEGHNHIIYNGVIQSVLDHTHILL